MQKFFIFLLIMIPFVVNANSSACGTAVTTVPNEYHEAIVKHYPNFSTQQREIMAHNLLALHSQKKILAQATEKSQRDLLLRSSNLLTRMGALHLVVFQSPPKMQDILQRMKDEQSAGAIHVSSKLRDELRQVAPTIVYISQVWAEISTDSTLLQADIFSSDPSADAAQKFTCAFESSQRLLTTASNLLPKALTLALVDDLRY